MERFAKYRRIIDGSPREANKLRDKLRRYVYNKVGVAENQHPFIIDNIFNVLLREAVPDMIIEVRTVNIIYRYTEERHLELLSEDADYLYNAKLIPSTESFIEALEEAATPPDDELQCAICMEMFALRKDSSITQLPCSHCYHPDCIVPWLQINHHLSTQEKREDGEALLPNPLSVPDRRPQFKFRTSLLRFYSSLSTIHEVGRLGDEGGNSAGGGLGEGWQVQEGGLVMKGGTVEASKGPVLCMERGLLLEILSTDKAAGISMPLSEATDTKVVGENEDQAVFPQAAGAIKEKVLLTPPDHMYDGFIDFFFGDVQVKGTQSDTAVVVFDSSDPVTEVLNGQRLIKLSNNKVVYAKPFTSLADL
ncbi:hypothetical protein ACLB2K_051372 [Fragaria x ananassa]